MHIAWGQARHIAWGQASIALLTDSERLPLALALAHIQLSHLTPSATVSASGSLGATGTDSVTTTSQLTY